jgi:hypothetical protein
MSSANRENRKVTMDAKYLLSLGSRRKEETETPLEENKIYKDMN